MGLLRRNWPAISLLLCDVAGFYILLHIAHRLRVGYWAEIVSWPVMITLLVTLITFYIMGAYNTHADVSWRRIFVEATVATAIAGIAVTTLTYLVGMPIAKNIPLFWRGVLPFAFLGFALYAASSRILARKFLFQTTENWSWLVVGHNSNAARLIQELVVAPMRKSSDVYLLDFDDTQELTRFIDSGQGTLIGLDQIEANELDRQWEGVIICQEEEMPESVLASLTHLRLKGVPIYELGEFYEMFWLKVPVFHSNKTPLSIAEDFGSTRHEIAYNAKRTLDIAIALGCVLLLPFMLLVAILIRSDSEGPALYWQTRIGANGKPIRIVKFRTMTVDAEKEGVQWTSVNDPRITKMGKVLRRWRIDELPQMWNVLKGDMSLIGPRPERPELITDLEKEIPFYDIRHIVKPGITGWAQVKHPYGSSIQDARKKLEYDLYYIKNYSLILDLIVALKTLRIIAMGAGR